LVQLTLSKWSSWWVCISFRGSRINVRWSRRCQ